MKTDFVTNSSSTVYIVYIPNKYPFTNRKILDAFETQKKWWDEEEYKNLTNEDVIDVFNYGIQKLKDGDNIHPDWDEEIRTFMFNVITEVLDKENLIVLQTDTSASGNDFIAPIKKENMEKIMNAIMIYGGDK
jgi:hypothetical protein